MKCSVCPRHCGAQREAKCGYCGCGEKFKIARAALHFWEEPCISGSRGSGAVFFSGCNMRCVYCQNYEISRDNKGIEISDERLAGIFEELIEQGAHNINLVNPTHYSHRLADFLRKYKFNVPIIYNCGGYEEVSALKELDGLIDIYLPDLKYTRSEKARRYSNAPDYFEKASAALPEMRRQVKDVFDGDGMMKSGMIVRHLILPQNTNSAIEAADWINENLPDTYMSLMAQYVPCGDLSDCPEIDRRLTKREYEKTVSHLVELKAENVFIQELSSADKKFIPAFDFTGIM